MIVLGTKDISKSFITTLVLKDITFNINEGEKVGLVGINGCGKSTLFRILTGELTADSGEIYKMKETKLGYLKQDTTLNNSNSIYQECLEVFNDVIALEKRIRQMEHDMANVVDNDELESILNKYQRLQDEFSENRGYSYNSEIKGMLKGLGFKEEELSMSIDKLSGGQKTRVQLAKLLLEKPDMLLLDEPTNHLDMDAIRFLEGFLKDFKGAVLLISHDRYFLDQVVNRIFHLENHEITIYNTNYSKYMVQRKKLLEERIQSYENQQKEIKRQQEIIDRFANYGSQRLIKQSQSRKKLLDKMKVIDAPVVDKAGFKLKFTPAISSGKDVLKVEGLEKYFGENHLFSNVAMDIYKGEKVGLIGPNGVGKTTLFKMILGKTGIDSGEIKIGHQVKIGYFDQEQRNLSTDSTIIDEIWDAYPKLTHFEIRKYLAKFLFVGDDIFKSIEDLSGGEKARLSLLKIMISDSNFLLMDEPTNHLDIDSKEGLEDALIDYEGTCLIISHDRYFLNRVVDKIIVLNEDQAVSYYGNYDYYIEKLKEQEEDPVEDKVSKTELTKLKRKKRESQREQQEKTKEIKNLESQIEKLEDEIKVLHNRTLDESLYENKEEMLKVFADMDNLEKQKELLYDQWLDLNE